MLGLISTFSDQPGWTSLLPGIGPYPSTTHHWTPLSEDGLFSHPIRTGAQSSLGQELLVQPAGTAGVQPPASGDHHGCGTLAADGHCSGGFVPGEGGDWDVQGHPAWHIGLQAWQKGLKGLGGQHRASMGIMKGRMYMYITYTVIVTIYIYIVTHSWHYVASLWVFSVSSNKLGLVPLLHLRWIEAGPAATTCVALAFRTLDKHQRRRTGDHAAVWGTEHATDAEIGRVISVSLRQARHQGLIGV